MKQLDLKQRLQKKLFTTNSLIIEPSEFIPRKGNHLV